MTSQDIALAASLRKVPLSSCRPYRGNTLAFALRFSLLSCCGFCAFSPLFTFGFVVRTVWYATCFVGGSWPCGRREYPLRLLQAFPVSSPHFDMYCLLLTGLLCSILIELLKFDQVTFKLRWPMCLYLSHIY